MNTRANMVIMRDMEDSWVARFRCGRRVSDPNPEIRLECPCDSAPLYITMRCVAVEYESIIQ